MKISKLSFAIKNDSDNQFIDIVVDGESIYDNLGLSGSGMSTVLSAYFTHSSVSKFVNYFEDNFNDPELKSGIAPFYVCGECGDYGCGIVGWRVESTPEFYKWDMFSWDGNLDEEDFSNNELKLPEILFSAKQYDQALLDIRKFFAIMKN